MHRVRRILLILVPLVLLALVALSGYTLLTARSELDRGITQLDAARAALQVSHVKASPNATLREARTAVRHAHVDFHAASTRLAPFAPLLRHLGWIPRVGLDLASAPALATTADDVTGGMTPLLRGLQPVAALFGKGHRGGGPVASRLSDRLAAQQPHFRRACAAFSSATAAQRTIPHTLSARAAQAVHTLDDQLPRLRTFCKGLVLAPALLGHTRPVTYLVAYEDAMELRAPGGFLGSAGIVTVRNGVAKQSYQDVLSPNENLSLQPPEPVAYYNTERWLFRDSNWAADFPTTAGLERFFYNLDFHHQARNIIDITPDGASALLAGVGPVYLPEYRLWVNAGNVGTLADFYAHWSATPGPLIVGGATSAISSDAQRKQFIQIVAAHVLQRLQHLSAGEVFSLGQSLATAVTNKGILINFGDRGAQALAVATGASGQIDPTNHDYLYVVDSNLSYNKINPYVHVRYRYATTIRRDRWLDVHLTVHITDGPLPARLYHSGIGPGAGNLGKPTDYADFLRIFTPNGAQLIDQSGWTQPWSFGQVYGKTMFCGYIIVPNGTSGTVRLHYVVPANVFAGSPSRYRLAVQHQPGSHPEAFTIVVRDEADGASRTWTVQHPGHDWSAAMPVKRLPVSPVPLPQSIVHPIVAPGHWIEPHAYLGFPTKSGLPT
jgi:hypothetical protein